MLGEAERSQNSEMAKKSGAERAGKARWRQRGFSKPASVASGVPAFCIEGAKRLRCREQDSNLRTTKEWILNPSSLAT